MFLLNVSDAAQRAILRLLALPPLRLGYAAAAVIGRLGYYLHEAGHHRGELRTLVMRALDVDRRQADRIVKANFTHLIKLLIEDARAAKLKKDWPRHVKISGLEYLQETLAKGNGAVLLSAHLGNTEMLMRGLPLCGICVHAVVLRQPPEFLYEYLDEARQLYGTQLLYTQDLLTPSGAKKAIAVLKGGGVLAMTGDPYGFGRNMVPFLGMRMAMPAGPVFFARKAGAPIVPIRIRRTGLDHQITIDPPLDLPLHDEQASLEQCAALMEGWIRACPEQFYWFLYRSKHNVRPLSSAAPPQPAEPPATRGDPGK